MDKGSGLLGLAGYLERRGDRAAEVLWDAALAMVNCATEEAGRGGSLRWRSYPRGELRRLRRDLAEALELARLAVAIREEDEEQARLSLADALHGRALAVARGTRKRAPRAS